MIIVGFLMRQLRNERIILLPPNDMKSLDSDQDFICKLHFSSNVVPICISIKTERM